MNKSFVVFAAVTLSVTGQSVFSQPTSMKNMEDPKDKKPLEMMSYTSEDNKNYTAGVDLSSLGEDAKVMFFNGRCLVIGKRGVPLMLTTSADFGPTLLPASLQSSVFGVVSVMLNPNLEDESGKDVYVPEWLRPFDDMKYLTLDRVRLTVDFFKQHDQLQHLFLIGGVANDATLLLEHTSELKSLQYLVHDGFLNEQQIREIKGKSPHLTILPEQEYVKKLESGEIKAPE